MKFLVFSDSHNYTNAMDRAIEKHKEIRHIIHCGDVAADTEYLHHVYGTTHAICAVRGNNDFCADEPFCRIAPVEGHRIYITHGHKEHVKQTLYTLTKTARTEHCDICIFGHTHTQMFEKQEEMYLLNPGSIGYARMEYAVLDIEKDSVNIFLYQL